MAISMRQVFIQQHGTGIVVSLRRLLATAGARSLRGAAPGSGESDSDDLSGAIGAHFRALDGDNGPLGSPISRILRLAHGDIAFFQHGMLWTGPRPDMVFYADAAMPLLGHPMFLSPSKPASILSLIVSNHTVAGLGTQRAPAADDVAVLREAMADRLFLNPIGESPTGGSLIPLAVHDRANGLKFAVSKEALGRLRDRQLYDIVLRLPAGSHTVLSAHAVYVASGHWKNFSFAHITDVHVAARADVFHRKLRRLADAGVVDSTTLAHFNNFNDNFCDFIRYANRLHARGDIDFVLATGDLVDYLFEKADDRPERGGNFALFKAIVLGRRASTDGRAGEELRVPMFTTLGNHDYRLNPYRLLNKVAITAGDVARDGVFGTVGDAVGSVLDLLGIGGAGVKVLERSEYGPYNLTKKEALALDGQPTIDARTAAKLVEIDQNMQRHTGFYFREFSRQGSYQVALGDRHRLVMVNTKHDSGITTDLGAVLAARLGIGREDSQKFIAGFVNSEGFSSADLALVKNAVKAASGLVIVGMHAPPLCHAGKEVSHFFRETEHVRAPVADAIHFLMRHHQKRLRPPLTESTVVIPPMVPVKIRELPESLLRGWTVDGTRFFRKASALDDNIAEGIADGSDGFLALCAGRGLGRQVDMVLCGHNHSNIEYRVRLDSKTGELEYFFDYYSANPATYYNSREFAAGKREVAVRVDAGLKQPGPLVETDEPRPGNAGSVTVLRRTVPANADSLDRASDRSQWWSSRRPLILQTPALGPIDRNQRLEENDNAPVDASFQGVRLIEVRDDVIAAIRMVMLAEIRKDVAASRTLRATG